MDDLFDVFRQLLDVLRRALVGAGFELDALGLEELCDLVEEIDDFLGSPGSGAVVTGAASGIGRAIATAFIEAGASGKKFSNAEMLSLQASMYKYTQELDLTSKVVEKATSGLKDVVKTQV